VKEEADDDDNDLSFLNKDDACDEIDDITDAGEVDRSSCGVAGRKDEVTLDIDIGVVFGSSLGVVSEIVWTNVLGLEIIVSFMSDVGNGSGSTLNGSSGACESNSASISKTVLGSMVSRPFRFDVGEVGETGTE